MALRLAAAAILVLGSSPFVPAAEPPGAAEPPVIPVGLDAYRMWDRWHYQRIGVRTPMRGARSAA